MSRYRSQILRCGFGAAGLGLIAFTLFGPSEPRVRPTPPSPAKSIEPAKVIRPSVRKQSLVVLTRFSPLSLPQRKAQRSASFWRSSARHTSQVGRNRTGSGASASSACCGARNLRWMSSSTNPPTHRLRPRTVPTSHGVSKTSARSRHLNLASNSRVRCESRSPRRLQVSRDWPKL